MIRARSDSALQPPAPGIRGLARWFPSALLERVAAMSTSIRLFSALLLLLPGTRCVAQQPTDAARKAKAVLEKHCHVCHGKNGAAEGGFGHLLDRNRLVSARTIVPGSPDRSKLYLRLTAEKRVMPPREDLDGKPITVRPTQEERDAIRDWIAAGAADFNLIQPARKFITPAAIFKMIVADLNAAPGAADRLQRRYLSIAHLHNAGHSADELLSSRNGLAKLINSLSWKSTIVVPLPIDAEKTIFRIDLRDYGWTAATWKRIVEANPYDTRLLRASAVEAAVKTRTSQPVVRADWFVDAASRPPLYHDVLGLPESATALEEALLGVDALTNVKNNKVRRAGFNGSGVSGNNRLLERHEIPQGRQWPARGAKWSTAAAYWKSYDFARNVGRENLFAFPLGPGPGPRQFQHAGGEIIFNLPNGLQAYLLVDDKNKRINDGPIKIVSDRRPSAPSVTVINGISCISCHSAGMIPKDDQVRDLMTSSFRKAFDRAEIVAVFSLYPKKEDFRYLLDEDAERFLEALKRTGTDASKTEPVTSLVGLFNKEVDLPLAAAEVGLEPEKFRAALAKAQGEVRRQFGSLLTGGTVKREVMAGHFRDLESAVSTGK
jgi:hypothetical protein